MLCLAIGLGVLGAIGLSASETIGAMQRAQMLLALAAYASYVVNAVQFLLKLRAARLSEPARRTLVEVAR